jgi:WD40 repeat protein
MSDILPLDPAKTKQAAELKHTAPLLGCRFDGGGRFVFAGGQEAAVQRWELATGKKTTLEGAKSWVRGLAADPAGKTVFAADYTGQVLAYPVEDEQPKPLWAVQAHQGWARALAVSPDGKTLASCGNDRLVRLWSAADGKPLATLAGHASHVYNVAFFPDGKQLASAELLGAVKHWDLAAGREVRGLDGAVLHKYDPVFMADHGGARGMTFSPDGQWLACCGITEVSNAFAGVGKPAVALFDWATGARKQLLRPKEAFQGTAWGVVFQPAGWVVAVGGGNGGVLWYWKPEDPVSAFKLALPTNARDLALHADGRRLAVACFDGAVRLYETPA